MGHYPATTGINYDQIFNSSNSLMGLSLFISTQEWDIKDSRKLNPKTLITAELKGYSNHPSRKW
jgi:hypothetical protein